MRQSRARTGRAVLNGCVAGILFAAAPALAHHSYASFNTAKIVKMKAIVKIWQLVNPHSYLWIYQCDDLGKPLPGADGRGVVWPLEAPGPSALLNHGWNKYTVKPGDPVTVSVNPLRDGRTGGSLVNLVLADGRSFNAGGPPNGGPAPAAAPVAK